jgi:hypothetical protein
MRAGRPLTVALFLFGSFGAQAQPGGPVETAVKYLEAAQASRCREVWALYSNASQEHIRSQVHRLARERGNLRSEEKPLEYSCSKPDKHKRIDTRLVRTYGDEATVAVVWRGRVSRRFYYLPGPMTEWTEEVKLVREGGAWKVDLPRPKEQKRLDELIELGDVEVSIGLAVAGLHQKLEAEGFSRVPRDALDAVLRDPRVWAAVLPSFKAIEQRERAGNLDRALLSFADPAPQIPVTVSLTGRPVDAKERSTSLQWKVEKDAKAPVYMRGQWFLDTTDSGTTRVRLTLVIDPRHWPGSEDLFSAERLANSLRDLEKAAKP